MSKYEIGKKYLEKIVKDQKEKYYEIVEDTYEYENGLILITYYDKEHKEEKEHFCINLDKIHNILYEEKKEKIRQKAIDWQLDFYNHNYSYGELAEFEDYFNKMGKRYGLLREFKNNGIC